MTHQTIAPLKNVALFNELVDRVMHRPAHLPGMATFHGYSGYGKTFSAIYAANKFQAYHVEAGESWSRTKFCDAILQVLGEVPKGTIANKVDTIIEILASDDKPLIIDEFDYIVQKKFVELVREIHDKSQAPIILIGEELLPDKLLEWERFHNRVLDWVPAQPADEADVAHLASLYCPGIHIVDDLIKIVHKVSGGRIRRVCVNLQAISEFCTTRGMTEISSIPDDVVSTGKPPQRRAA